MGRKTSCGGQKPKQLLPLRQHAHVHVSDLVCCCEHTHHKTHTGCTLPNRWNDAHAHAHAHARARDRH
jgi:hypothetical protein